MTTVPPRQMQRRMIPVPEKNKMVLLIVFRYFLTPAVEVVVGTDETEAQTFVIHQGLICPRSEFFKTALGDNWAKPDQKIKLTDEDPRTFALYQALLYTGLLPVNDNHDIQYRYLELAKLYVLCEKLIDSKEKATALDAILELCRTKGGEGSVLPDHRCTEIIYDGTQDNDTTRTALATQYVEKLDSTTAKYISNRTLWPADFYYDLSLITTRRVIQEREKRVQAVEDIEVEISCVEQALRSLAHCNRPKYEFPKSVVLTLEGTADALSDLDIKTACL
ncbi:hypothetical protein M011DRAFT_5981 [Sporormia fimetaria CBS 119925]|uniref:BTB domain-containing protein n=1 Tax=Sporormia fimetaria CBS 119925 TaxID=1340428 RepID=A0A6A6VMM3_9PLEO|nr:hypothetical protein M011DRAFT_5981 [Sporormia fimetaria CBS 119925]